MDDRFEVVELLLQNGTSIDEVMFASHQVSYCYFQAFQLDTPLHQAVRAGDLDMLRFLLDRGANPSIKDSCGVSVLDRGEKSSNPEIRELFKRHGSK